MSSQFVQHIDIMPGHTKHIPAQDTAQQWMTAFAFAWLLVQIRLYLIVTDALRRVQLQLRLRQVGVWDPGFCFRGGARSIGEVRPDIA